MVKLLPVAMWTSNQLNPTVQVLFPNNDAIFQDYNSHTHPHTHLSHTHTHIEPEVFSLGLRSMKMHFNIFPSQSNGQT